jgi:hypothetical protein
MNVSHAAVAAAAMLIATAAGAKAQDADVRDFRVGMAVAALPSSGYKQFACAGVEPPQAISGWGDYKQCPADAAGGREVAFRYDDPGKDETRVAGQEILISLVLGPDGTVEAIRMKTDPHARLFRRKRGFIFGEQVMARYGEADWSCKDAQPKPGEEAVGGQFVRQHCEKVIGDRHLIIDRALYREAGDGPGKFVSETSFVVRLVHGE